MEPALGGRAAVVLAYYNQLRLEIQALVAENQELIQALRLLRGQQRAARVPMVTPPLANASERQFFPNAAPANTWRPPDQGAVFQYPSREQYSEQGSWNRVLLPSVGGDIGGGILGGIGNEPLLQTTSSLGSISAGPIPLAGGSLGGVSGAPLALAGGGISGIGGGLVAQGGGSIGSISGGPIPQGSFGIASGGPIALGSGTLGSISSTPLLQGSGSTLGSISGGSIGTITGGPIVQGGSSFGSSIIGGPTVQGGGSIGSISGISAGPVAHSTGPIPLGSGSFGSSGGSVIGGPTVQSGGSGGGVSAGPVAQSAGSTAQGSGTLGTISSQPLLQSGSTLGSSGGGTLNTGPIPQGSGSIGTITGGSIGTISGGPITQGGGSRSVLAVPSPSGSPPLASHSFSSTGGDSSQVPPQGNPEPPQDVPVSPRDVPGSPRDVPAPPQDVPVSPRDVSMPPQDSSIPAQNASVSEPMMPGMSNFGLQMSDLQVSRARVPRDASRVLSGLDQPQTSTPGGAQQQTWEQLVGEVAFQLDRRILARVFPDRPRLYGFTVSNIPEKIVAISLGAVPEAIAEQWASAAVQRYLGLMRQLRALGYSPSVHPAFAESLVNTYGILADRPAPNSDITFLRQVITNTVPGEARERALQLLHCLDMLARDDGNPLLS